MTKKKSNLEKYLKVNDKYYDKFRDLAARYTLAVCRAIGAEYIGYETKLNYPHIKYKNKDYQAGGFDPYFYTDAKDLSDVLREELFDERTKTSSRASKKTSKEKQN